MASKLNYIFIEMKQRCYNPNHKRYMDYGGRGITICKKWLDKTIIVVNGQSGTKGWFTFKEWALSHGYQDGLSIDRIDNNQGYSPDNCRWITTKEQNNNRRCNHLILYKGKTQTLAQWCEEHKLDYNRTFVRLYKYHWSVERAFEIKDNAGVKLINYNGKKQSMAEWCKELGLPYTTIASRLNKLHWSVEKAFKTYCL